MRRVLVTDGNQRSTLALVRSLGKKGIDVTVAEDRLPCLASKSKYCHNSFEYASPLLRPYDFIDNLIKEVQRVKYDMLIPMTDVTCYMVVEHKNELSSYTNVPMVEAEAFNLASDKGEVIRLAQRLDLPIPTTFFIEHVDEIRDLDPCLSYPVIIKPRRSKYLTPGGWISTSVEYAFSLEQLIQKVEGLDPTLPLPLIQERIRGPGYGAFLLFNKGEEKAIFIHQRLREKPPSGGVSVLRQSVPVNPTIRENAVSILKALNWHGVAMVEFKLDERDGLPKVMEINPRFWGSLQLAIDSGVDFPYLLYRLATEGVEDMVSEYETGVKTRWLMGDIDHLLIRLFKSDRKLNLPEGFPSRLATLKEFFRFSQDNMKYEIMVRDDIAPAIFEIREYARDIIRRLPTKLLGRRRKDDRS